MKCLCSSCAPSSASLQCSRCGEEVRWGTRDGVLAYHHREAHEHAPVFGHLLSTEQFEEAVATALARSKKSEAEEAAEAPLEPVEVRMTPISEKGVTIVEGREIEPPGGVRVFANLAPKVGWTIRRLTYSRGPYLSSTGKSLGVSDCILMILAGPPLDGVTRWVVGWWRDGKSTSVWTIEDGVVTIAGAKAAKEWMKAHAIEPEPKKKRTRRAPAE